jgi:integrase/recombinase XerD
MAARNSTPALRNLNPETVLKNFAVYLSAQVGLGETTIANYLSTLRRLMPVLGLRPTARAVDKFIAEMRKNGCSHSHLVNTSIALERYGAFMHIGIHLARPKQPQTLVTGALSQAEVARLIGASKTLREKAILALLAYSGGRNKEICWLRIRDLDTAHQLLHINGTKKLKERAVMISSACCALMMEYFAVRAGQPDDWMFLTVRRGHRMQQQDLRKLVRVAAKRAGITRRVYPHLVRHSLGANMLNQGSGLLAIKEQLGHVYIDTTMRYLHSAPARLQEEYRMHAPSYL